MNIKYLLFTSIWLIVASCSQKSNDLVDLVNPNIGGISPLLETTVPLVNLPKNFRAFRQFTAAIHDDLVPDLRSLLNAFSVPKPADIGEVGGDWVELVEPLRRPWNQA